MPKPRQNSRQRRQGQNKPAARPARPTENAANTTGPAADAAQAPTRPIAGSRPASVLRQTPATRTEARPSRLAEDMRHRYPYIIADLRRIGMLAAGLMVVLIALSFVLR
jgi:hypothetical protein